MTSGSDASPGANVTPVPLFLVNQGNMEPSYEIVSAAAEEDTGSAVVQALQAAALLLLAIVGSYTNCLVFIVFYRRPTLRSPSNRFVLSLVTANLLASLVVMPVVLVQIARREMSHFFWWRQMVASMTALVVTASIFSIVTIAVDRYNAVISPLHYTMTITRKRSRLMIGGVWGLSLLLAAPPLLGIALRETKDDIHPPESPECETSSFLIAEGEVFKLSYSLVLVTLGFTLPFLALCWIYVRMYHAAHRNSERTRRHSLSTNPGEMVTNTATCEPPGTPESGLSNHVGRRKMPKRRCSNASLSALFFREEGRAVKTAAMVIASFLFCWTPYFVSLLLETSLANVRLPEICRYFVLLTALSSSSLTPFIYVYRNETARKEALKVMFFWQKAKQTQNQSYSFPIGTQKIANGQHSFNHSIFDTPSKSWCDQESISIQSFPTECQRCGSVTADFIATYEVIESPDGTVEADGNRGTATVSSSIDESGVEEVTKTATRTRRESVTFRLAFLPRAARRRCETCIRQNSDSSSGSGHPLLRDVELSGRRTPPPMSTKALTYGGERGTATSEPATPKHCFRHLSNQSSASIQQGEGQVILELEESRFVVCNPTSHRPRSSVMFQETSLASSCRDSCITQSLESMSDSRLSLSMSHSVSQDQGTTARPNPILRQDSICSNDFEEYVSMESDNRDKSCPRQDSNFSDISQRTVDSGVVADISRLATKKRRHRLQRLAALEDPEDALLEEVTDDSRQDKSTPTQTDTAACVTLSLPNQQVSSTSPAKKESARTRFANGLKSSFKSRFYRPAFRIPQCDF